MSTTEAEAKLKKTKSGFNDKGEAYPGVNPETGERVTVTLEGLKKEFGPKAGEVKYRAIGQALGVRDAFAPLEQYSPDIQIKGISNELQFKVDEVLSAKE